jgi:hypothetical protein
VSYMTHLFIGGSRSNFCQPDDSQSLYQLLEAIIRVYYWLASSKSKSRLLPTGTGTASFKFSVVAHIMPTD